MSRFAPKAHLTAPIWNWGPFYKDMVTQVQSGTWKPASMWPGLESGIIDLAPFGPMVPQDLQARVLAAKQAIIDGSLKVFSGPVKDQTGKVAIPDGTTPTDGQLLGMDWFVQGVQGSTK
jgi:basic membrane protein A